MTGSCLIRAVIVDDEAPARSELRYLLEQHPDLCVVSEAANSQEALAAVRQSSPHLVFLDVEMPGASGVEIAEQILETRQPLLVFATAHEEFALKAFELNAVDYLLKPISPRRLEQCVDRVRNLLAARSTITGRPDIAARESAAPPRNKLAIEHGGKTAIICVHDIIAASSAEGQVNIYTPGKVYHAAMTLQELQGRLDETLFFRSHRGCIVNLEKIREVVPWFNGAYNLVLEGLSGVDFPVSRQQAPKLRKIFNL